MNTFIFLFVSLNLISLSKITRICIANKVGSEVLTAVSTKMAVFWIVAPCSLAFRPVDGGSKYL
jgi:hypothetical protein